MVVQVFQSTALPDGLRYYLLRDSTMVPLVPIDQLPFQLHGIPRKLTHRQVSDENWKLIQETEQPAISLSVQAPSSILPSHSALSPKLRFLAPDHHVRTDPTCKIRKTPQLKSWTTSLEAAKKSSNYPQSSQCAGPEHLMSLSDSFASIYQKDAQRLNYRTQYPSGIEPDPSKKEFCTHWIKTGECAFISVGCKYKHEMPMMDRLRELGFTQLPKWWKDKSAIIARSPTWMQRRLASGNEEDEHPGDARAPRAFPDPSTFRLRQTDNSSLAHGEPLARSTLQRNAISGQVEALPINPPPVPIAEATIRREGQISNFLIDLDEAPARSSSPQPSNSSSTSAGSWDTLVTAERRKEKERCCQPAVRRCSLISWASDGGEIISPTKPLNRHTESPRMPARRYNDPTKQQTGLNHSKYAVVNTIVNDHQAKNANRRMLQREGNRVSIMELRTKIDPNRRNVHHKNRARKGAAGEVGAALVAVKQVSG